MKGAERSTPPPPKDRIGRLLHNCGGICDYRAPREESVFFDYVKVNVDCEGLGENDAIDEATTFENPLPKIPDELLDAFTYGGKVSVRNYHGGIKKNYYLNKTADMHVWKEDLVDKMATECKAGTLSGNYEVHRTNAMVQGLRKLQVAGARVLVIGSENPWLEACIIAEGAEQVTTLEYGEIISEHPKINTATPAHMRKVWRDYFESFDVVATFSSVEHSGLARYGDAFNPWGDSQTIARAWCLTKKGGRLVIGVPTGHDSIEYNAHRIYGRVMYPHLVANWKQVYAEPGASVDGDSAQQYVYGFVKNQLGSVADHVELPTLPTS